MSNNTASHVVVTSSSGPGSNWAKFTRLLKADSDEEFAEALRGQLKHMTDACKLFLKHLEPRDKNNIFNHAKERDMIECVKSCVKFIKNMESIMAILSHYTEEILRREKDVIKRNKEEKGEDKGKGKKDEKRTPEAGEERLKIGN